MSTIKLTATGGGGGTVSLKAPSATQSNGALELVLPTADGSANQLLKTDGSGNLGWATDVGGKVLGYNHTSTSTGTDCSSFTDFTTISNFALSYTPTASNSKLLFMGMFQLTIRASNSSYYGTMEYRIKHGSHGNSEHVALYQPPGSGTATAYTDTVTYITQFDAQDTNARDFEIQIHNANAASGVDNGHMYINEYSGRSSMQVMEISA